MARPFTRKICIDCGLMLNKDNGYIQRPNSSGIGKGWRARCRKCSTIFQRRREAKRFSDLKYRARFLWLGTKNRAKRKGIEFTLSLNWVEDRIRKGVCEATKIPIDWKTHNANPGPWGPSIDRTDPKLGYTESNSKIVCWAYNRAKGSDSHSVVVTLSKAIINLERKYEYASEVRTPKAIHGNVCPL